MLFPKLSIPHRTTKPEICRKKTMDTRIENYIRQTPTMEWKPLQEAGIDTAGIYVKALRYDENGRPPSILLKFEAGAEYPYHNHPAGEEIFVMEGSCSIEGAVLNAGDYLYTPPGFKHGVRSEKGCILLLIIPEEVELEL